MYCMCEKYGSACACDVKSLFQRVLCAIKNPVADNKPAHMTFLNKLLNVSAYSNHATQYL